MAIRLDRRQVTDPEAVVLPFLVGNRVQTCEDLIATAEWNKAAWFLDSEATSSTSPSVRRPESGTARPRCPITYGRSER